MADVVQHPNNRAAPKAPGPQTISERVKRLQAEARALAAEHIHALTAAMGEVERLAAEIAVGGEAYPAGVRDLARRLAEDCAGKVQVIQKLGGRP